MDGAEPNQTVTRDEGFVACLVWTTTLSSFHHRSQSTMLMDLLRAEMFQRLEIDQVWQHQRLALVQEFCTGCVCRCMNALNAVHHP